MALIARRAEPAPDRLTPERRAWFAESVPVSSGSPEKAPRFNVLRCPWCGGAHSRACPRVAKFTYDGSGRVTSVEFWAWGTWSEGDVVWAEDVWPSEPEGGSQ